LDISDKITIETWIKQNLIEGGDIVGESFYYNGYGLWLRPDQYQRVGASFVTTDNKFYSLYGSDAYIAAKFGLI